jgi:hypothetical protein
MTFNRVRQEEQEVIIIDDSDDEETQPDVPRMLPTMVEPESIDVDFTTSDSPMYQDAAVDGTHTICDTDREKFYKKYLEEHKAADDCKPPAAGIPSWGEDLGE